MQSQQDAKIWRDWDGNIRNADECLHSVLIVMYFLCVYLHRLKTFLYFILHFAAVKKITDCKNCILLVWKREKKLDW